MRRRPALRSAVAAAAATTLLLGLSACSDDSSPAAEEPSGEESSASEPAEDVPEGGETVDKAEFVDDMMAGLEESTTARMTMSSDFGGAGLEAEGQVDYTTDPVSMAMTMSGGPIGEEGSELRLVDGIMYMNLGSMSNEKFLRFDLSDPSSLPPGMAGVTDQMDPLAAFEEFEPALKTVTFEGTEDVAGEKLHHYSIVLDTAEVESLKDIPAEAGIPPEVDYDLWFDDEFRMRQMEMTMDMAQPVTVEAKLFDWGEPVEISAPPEGEVVQPPQA